MEEKNTTILLAEDDALIRDLYEQAFQLKGYRIKTAVDGHDAVQMLETMDPLPDLVLLDIMMPKLSGFDVLKYIKASDKFKNILVVILTNLGEQEDAEKALKFGAARYLVKTEHEPREVVQKAEEIIAEFSKK